MTDLSALIPPHEHAEDTLATVGGIALDAIPIVGPMAARALDLALAASDKRRRHTFDVAVVAELTRIADGRDDALTVADVVDSDEFLAALTRGQRAAAETASENKRRRLATAVAHAGEWAPFSASERILFARLVADFDDLHVWVLHYFVNPRAWLDGHDLTSVYSSLMMAGISTTLGPALGVPDDIWRGPVQQAIGDLQRAGLADIPLTTMMSTDGILAQRTSAKGARFLAFLNEPDSHRVDPPSDL